MRTAAALPILSRSLRIAAFDEGRRSFFDDFLVAALDRAIALAQVNDVALVIAENLKLDVMWVLNVFLDVNPGIAEGFLGLGAGGAVAFD